MSNKNAIIIYCFLLFYLCSCEHNTIEGVIEKEAAVINIDSIRNRHAIIEMQKRAKQIANIEWTPLLDVPNRIGVYPAEQLHKGIPYSSVKELDKFVGQEVSFHTFMTAVHNPFSVLYTERVNEFPYKGVNCGAYYGTVCSMAVNYALGIELPYESKMYKELSDFIKLSPNSPEYIREGDILWFPGHVVLVTDIQQDTAGSKFVEILESSGFTTIKKYSFEFFRDMWQKKGWIAFRYLKFKENAKNVQAPFLSLEGDLFTYFQYNDDICTKRGDKACYREGEEVEINVFNNTYEELELYRNDELLSSMPPSWQTQLYIF